MGKNFLVLIIIACSSFSVIADTTLQWPFDRPSLPSLRKSPKKVFFHYFCPYPISLDNRKPGTDYYARGYNAPDGERNKHLAYGGFFRQRPLPRMPRKEAEWRLQDMIDEVNMAADLGADGFCFDILTTKGQRWNQFLLMLKAVNLSKRDFKVVLMPDMESELKRNPGNLVPAIMKVANNPALYHLDDGRLVLAPYNAQRQTPEWWAKTLKEFEAKGVKIAFVPLFQAWWRYVDKYADISYAFSDWGCSTIHEQSNGRRKHLANDDRHGLKFMAPVRPQDFRPKNFRGSEGRNSALFREMWDTAMDAKADWVQVVTWNDYSESSEIAPSSCTRHSFYDLTAYYITWFKTGKQPEIVRDAIYYFYRTQPVNATFDTSVQKKKFKMTGKPYDEIELLAFMKQPGTLEISIDGKTEKKDFPAGINSFRVPLKNGRPEFKLVRNGKTVISKVGAWTIRDKVKYENYLVHGDGGTAELVRDYSSPRVPPKPQLRLGKKIRTVTDLNSAKFENVSGNPNAVKMDGKSLEKPVLTSDGKGAFAIRVGAGPSHRGGNIDLGEEYKLKTGEEIIFYIKRLDMVQKKGWIAVFLSITKDSKNKISFTLRNPAQTYISCSLPKFKVARGNFSVDYPEIYRIRKLEDRIEFIYGNSPIYTYKGDDAGSFKQISMYMSTEKSDSAALLKISAIELRKAPEVE